MALEAEYSFEYLASSNTLAFDEFYGIYVEALPLRERKPRTQIAAIAGRSDYRVLLLKRNVAVVGFSILFTPPGELFCLLEYMAVHSAYRNSGLGGELFRRTFEHVVTNDGTVHGLLEVESDREQSVDREIRTRRQRFYRRLGCLRVAGLAYALPLPGEGPPPPMDLLVYPPGGSPRISRHQLEHWLKVIYIKVYDCAPDDPRIADMMKAIGDPVTLA